MTDPGWIVHDEKRQHLPELADHCVICLTEEVEALRSLVRKISGGVMWWAALSYLDGWGGRKSRWNKKEQALLRRAMEG